MDFPANHLRFIGGRWSHHGASPHLSLVSVGFNFTAWSSPSKGLAFAKVCQVCQVRRSRNEDDAIEWKPQQNIQFMRSLIPDFFCPIKYLLHFKEFWSWHGRWRANVSTTLKTFLLLSGCRTSFSQWLFGDISIFLVSEYFGTVWWITRHIQHWQNMPLVVIYYTRQILQSTYHFKIPIKPNQPTFTNQ